MGLQLRPITRDDAKAFIRNHHRHHGVPVGDLWRHAVQDEAGEIVGVCLVGRPVARELDDGLTCEVTRLATDTHPNACSMLYGAARRTAIEKGYRRGLTYILASETGATLRAAGWVPLWTVKGRSWNCVSRPPNRQASDRGQASIRMGRLARRPSRSPRQFFGGGWR